MSTTQYFDVQQSLQNLTETAVHPENIEAIRRFIETACHEGITTVTAADRYAERQMAEAED